MPRSVRVDSICLISPSTRWGLPSLGRAAMPLPVPVPDGVPITPAGADMASCTFAGGQSIASFSAPGVGELPLVCCAPAIAVHANKFTASVKAISTFISASLPVAPYFVVVRCYQDSPLILEQRVFFLTMEAYRYV